MTPEQVLEVPPTVLTREQREFYFENGYLLVESIIPKDWIARAREVTAEMVERTRTLTKSDAVFDLEPGHSADSPRLRRLTSPVEHHPFYWEWASQSVIADLAADLVGPDVKFHHSKLNFKWAGGGEEVKWHQDISYWPHTNYSPLTIGVYLHDVGDEQGPLGAVPRLRRFWHMVSYRKLAKLRHLTLAVDQDPGGCRVVGIPPLPGLAHQGVCSRQQSTRREVLPLVQRNPRVVAYSDCNSRRR